MEKASVLELRDKILVSARREARQRMGAGLQSLAHPRVESRLAVGYSQVKKNDYRLELRVQRTDGKAVSEAEEIRTQANGEANIEVIPKVEIPPQVRLLESEEGRAPLCKRCVPLEMGVSVGHANGGAGTLGAFIGTPDGNAILSNNHVLALLNTASKGDPIYHPGKPHKTPLALQNRIGRLSDYNLLDSGDRNKFDAATAVLDPDVDFRANVIPSGLRCPAQGKKVTRVLEEVAFGPEDEVWKIGCSTGFTRGRVTAVGVSDLTVWTSAGNMVFDDVIEIRGLRSSHPFTSAGDSGSLVFTDRLEAFGLHFSGGSARRDGKSVPVSFCCSLSAVLDFFQAAMLS